MTLPFLSNEADVTWSDQAEPDAIDFGILVGGFLQTGVQKGGAVTEAGTPGQTVAIAAGEGWFEGKPVTWAATSGLAISAADGTNPRFDIIGVTTAGTKVATAGTAAAQPVIPAVPADTIVLAVLYVPANDNTHQNAQIQDKRIWLEPRTTINIAAYGLDPDNTSAQNVTAFDNAIAAMSDGWTLAFPGLDYHFDSTLKIPGTLQGIMLKGSGGKGRDVSGITGGTTLHYDGTTPDVLMVFNETPGGQAIFEGITFENINFTVTDETNDKGLHTLLQINDTNHWSLRYCTFSYGAVGFKTTTTNDGAWNEAIGCKFWGNNIGADLDSGNTGWYSCEFNRTSQHKSGTACKSVYIHDFGGGNAFYQCQFNDAPVHVYGVNYTSFFGCVWEWSITLNDDIKWTGTGSLTSGQNIYPMLVLEGTANSHAAACRETTIQGAAFDGGAGLTSSREVGIWLKDYVQGVNIHGVYGTSLSGGGPYSTAAGPDAILLDERDNGYNADFPDDIGPIMGNDGTNGDPSWYPSQIAPELMTKAGAVVDGDFASMDVQDGVIAFNETLSRMYGRINGQWRFAQFGRGAVSASGSTHTVDSTHSIVDYTNATACTVTLPDCASYSGKGFLLRRNGTGTITINRAGSDTIGGATSKVLGSDEAAIGIFSTGTTDWQIVSTVGTVT